MCVCVDVWMMWQWQQRQQQALSVVWWQQRRWRRQYMLTWWQLLKRPDSEHQPAAACTLHQTLSHIPSNSKTRDPPALIVRVCVHAYLVCVAACLLGLTCERRTLALGALLQHALAAVAAGAHMHASTRADMGVSQLSHIAQYLFSPNTLHL